ncbi:sensor histidine kinase [Ketobacter sp.]|uniref:sensor histidine kinase n=1 Tax=Ketobacter sp. TaxID=2083498 RepID=UPI000F247281|nr:ATP-binding protein [Ketobacter sp.]RLT96787.1 MAG: two-component sensor histidine kinase [Ketobacter sp.]
MSSLDSYKRELEIQRQARRVAEAQLEDKSRELYQKNQALEAALLQLKEQQELLIAKEKQASIGQLSAGLAHEINNPNAFVQSNLESLHKYVFQLTDAMQVLLSKIEDSDPRFVNQFKHNHDLDFLLQDASDLIQESVQGSQRIQRIVQGLRYFSQTDQRDGRQFDINSCIHSTVELISHEPELQVRINKQLSVLKDCEGNPTLMSLAIGNLLKNAAQSHPRSGEISIRSEQVGQEIRITVSDDGDGIPLDQQPKIFEPFYTTRQPAHGLGLTISQAIVRQHDGRIECSSQPGQGTDICIRLPTAP